MSNMKLSVISVMILVSIFACGQTTFNGMVDDLISKKVKTISVDELQNEMKHDKVLVLDAREQKEYDVSHIENAVFCGYNNFNMKSLVDISKDTKIVVYCSVGYRSGKIGEKLQKQGFKNVFNLYGGIFDWVNSGYPVYDSKGETNRIHGYDKSWGKWLRRGEKICD